MELRKWLRNFNVLILIGGDFLYIELTQEIYGDPTVYHVTRNVNLWRPNSFGCHNCMLCDIVNVAWLKVLVSSLITQQFKYAYGWGLVSPAGVRVDGFRLGSRRLTAF